MNSWVLIFLSVNIYSIVVRFGKGEFWSTADAKWSKLSFWCIQKCIPWLISESERLFWRNEYDDHGIECNDGHFTDNVDDAVYDNEDSE